MVEKQIGASKAQDHCLLSILIVKQVWAGKAQGKSAKAAIAKQNKVEKFLTISRTEVDLIFLQTWQGGGASRRTRKVKLAKKTVKQVVTLMLVNKTSINMTVCVEIYQMQDGAAINVINCGTF